MPRLMSVALTEAAVVERRKTVTRRLGWTFAKPGDRITLCRKVMGRRKGEPLVRLADVELVSVRRERLCEITPEDVKREGFDLDVEAFIDFFTEHMRTVRWERVTRLEWKYLDTVGGKPVHVWNPDQMVEGDALVIRRPIIPTIGRA